MKKIICTLIPVFICLAGMAQDFWQDFPYLNRDTRFRPQKIDSNFNVKSHNARKPFITAIGFYNAGCDGVNNEFLTSFYRGGYMDSAFIEKSCGALLPSNRLGVMTQAGLTYGFHVNDTSGEILTVSLLRRNNISARFPDDAFHLTFQGNTRYKGEQADFGGTRVTSMSWSQLKVGYLTPQKTGAIAFSFSLLVGHNYNEANVHYGKLFTDSQGTFLDGSVAADYWSTDTTNRSTFAMNGWGTSVDITWAKAWRTKSADEFITARVDFLDFGFINWNSKTLHRTTDTTFEWRGVDISNLFIDPDYTYEIPTEEEFIKNDTTEFHRSVFLPGLIRATYEQTFFITKLTLKASCAIPVWSEALPYESLTATYHRYNGKFSATGGIAYGGYARLQVPCKLELLMIRNTTIELGTTNALGFIQPQTFSGSGAYVKLSYCL